MRHVQPILTMIIDGKKIAQEILDYVHGQVNSLKGKRLPGLAFVLVGDHAPSRLYVKMKERACQKVGLITKGHYLKQDVEQSTVLALIDKLNQDPSIDGILVQMPLPEKLNLQKIVESIDPKKDVDGLHPFNVGRLLQGYTPYFIPCTPLGIQQLLIKSKIPIAGQHIVIMGRSNLVGKPLAALLIQKNNHANATVTLVHSKTPRLEQITSQADILVAAMGVAEFVTVPMVKKGATIIDVGINRLDKKLVGDVAFESVRSHCKHISPVPGGVGPMTIAMLISNTLKSYQQREDI